MKPLNRQLNAVLLLTLLPFGGCPAPGRDCNASDFAGINTGARSAAMGNSAVVSTGLDSMAVNPAGLSLLESGEGEFCHLRHFEGILLNRAAAAFPAGFCAAGFSFLSMDVPEFQGYDERGFQTRKIKSSGNVFAAAVSFPASLGRRGVSFGLGLKYVTERLDLQGAEGLGMDAGLHYRTLLAGRELSAGISATGLPGGSSAVSPSESHAGVSYAPVIFGKLLKIAVTAALPVTAGFSVNSFGAGAEFRVLDSFALRGGIGLKEREKPEQNVTWGLSLKISQMVFEYANLLYGELGPTHRFSIRTRFGGAEKDPTAAEESFEKGMDLYGEGRFAEAMLEFNAVIKKDPLNADALEMLRKSFEQIK